MRYEVKYVMRWTVARDIPHILRPAIIPPVERRIDTSRRRSGVSQSDRLLVVR